MKFDDLIKKLNPMGKRSFNKVTTSDSDRMELDEASGSAFSPSSIHLKLIDSSDSEHEDAQHGENNHLRGRSSATTHDFVVPCSDFDRKVYNSPTQDIPEQAIVPHPSSLSIISMLGFGEDNDDPNKDLNLGRPNHTPDHTHQHEEQHHHPEAELLGPISYHGGRRGPRRRLNLGGIRLCLILAMIIFVITIMLTVTAVFILDSHELHNGTEKENTTKIDDSPKPFLQQILYNDNEPILDVNDLDKQKQDSHVNESAIMNLLPEETTISPRRMSHLALTKFSISPEIIRESYQNALNTFEMSNEPLSINFSEPVQHALVMELAYHNIVKRLNLSNEQAEEGEILLINATLPSDLCPNFLTTKPLLCNKTERYRSLNGGCNNFHDPDWGSVGQAYRRLLFPKYDDGISAAKTKGVGKSNLPSARFVSHMIHIDEYRADTEVSSMTPLWAQFVAHDIMYTAKFPRETGKGCCKANGNNPGCFPIPVPANDAFYSDKMNITCLDFHRAAPYGTSCRFGPREQLNKQTSFIDASHIYGVTPEISASLRVKDPQKLGQMMLDDLDGIYLLPSTNETSKCISDRDDMSSSESCFRSGDDRVNDLMSVTAMITIWVRHHNRVAETLSGLNKHWDDEKVFQETRRLVIAQIQHITYNEFLPVLLRTELLKSGHLALSSSYSNSSYFKGFDVNLNPQISNEFTAAFKFYVSMMQGLMKKMSPHRNDEDFLQFHKMVRNPSVLKKDGELDRLLMGASSHPVTKVDAFISGQITNHMYQHPNSNYGTDLAALIIQEGRDQGIPPYIEVAKKCGLLIDVQKFSDLHEIWASSSLNAAIAVYESVQDVDLFTGLLSERPEAGSKVGPTLGCIIVDQFSRLRKGDMFWYEGDIRPHHFTPEQLTVIRKTKLSKIICQNSDKIRQLQGHILLLPNDRGNPVVRCAEISKMKLNAWKEHQQTNNSDHQSSHSEEEEEVWSSSYEEPDEENYQ
ncbi:peroxidase [Folsomia candida]|uniref:peroxidase n=1 Tax=Folsomia candida TaxID=158441 RepID=UPI000B8F1D31|nr:peroxidase [Folsomia candida]